jgi:hypothetical protein
MRLIKERSTSAASALMAGSFSACSSCWTFSAFAQNKPNIVYFLVDNLGYGELGANGAGLLRGAAVRLTGGLAQTY